MLTIGKTCALCHFLIRRSSRPPPSLHPVLSRHPELLPGLRSPPMESSPPLLQNTLGEASVLPSCCALCSSFSSELHRLSPAVPLHQSALPWTAPLVSSRPHQSLTTDSPPIRGAPHRLTHRPSPPVGRSWPVPPAAPWPPLFS
jgi:hypothetical protein